MSFKTMLAHRAKILELVAGEVNGYPTHVWTPVQTQDMDPVTGDPLWSDSPTNTIPVMVDLVFPCFLDLMFTRKGKDPVWTPEAGRASDRGGVLFCQGGVPLKASSRVLMVKGPAGTYAVEMAVDEAWKPDTLHHLEIYVSEVAKQVA